MSAQGKEKKRRTSQGSEEQPAQTDSYRSSSPSPDLQPEAEVGPDADRMCTPAAQMLSPPVPGGSPPPAPRKPKYRRKPQLSLDAPVRRLDFDSHPLLTTPEDPGEQPGRPAERAQ